MTEPADIRPDRPAKSPLSRFRLDAEIDRLKGETAWSSGTRNAITLAKGPLTIVLVALKPGATLEEHRARGPMTLEVLSGSIRFRSAETVSEVEAGQLVVLESALAHEVEALTESALLLTLAET
jgi:quercetin dioxygenase-like cupin family protein